LVTNVTLASGIDDVWRFSVPKPGRWVSPPDTLLWQAVTQEVHVLTRRGRLTTAAVLAALALTSCNSDKQEVVPTTTTMQGRQPLSG
jgi:hypothetical protein